VIVAASFIVASLAADREGRALDVSISQRSLDGLGVDLVRTFRLPT